ncbi:hypothetical protein TWF192_001398 [Orbilia oligospora]|nr:hypothetical protein TWF192_001398 [Orbilia oligospora]
MRLLQVAALALGLASSCSFAHEAPDRGSPDRKRDQSVDDYYATSWTETVTRGASVVVIVHPHAQTRPHEEEGDDEDDGMVRAISLILACPHPQTDCKFASSAFHAFCSVMFEFTDHCYC